MVLKKSLNHDGVFKIGSKLMVNYCEALGDFLIEYFHADRFEGTEDYDKAIQMLLYSFSFNAPYDELAVYMIDKGVEITLKNIVLLLKQGGYKVREFRDEDEEYSFICRNVFKFLAGLFGIPKLKKKDKQKYASILASILSVDTNWRVVWSLFLNGFGGFNLKFLFQKVIETLFDEMDVPVNLIKKVTIQKIGRNTYTLSLKVSREYMKIVDAKKHSLLKKRLGKILIELG